MRVTATVACAVALYTSSPLLAQTGDGYVGVYVDPAGTQACATVNQFATLYVIAKLSGASSAGITGAEFRIEVESPSDWQFSYHAPEGATIVLGNPIDTNPQDPNDGSGLRIAFASCQPPVNGQVSLGTLSVYKEESAPPTNLLVKAHSSPSNSSFPCPLFVLCDAPYYSKVCMSTSSESCVLQKPTTAQDAAADGRVFATPINIDVDAPPQSMKGSELINALRSERKIPVNFVTAASEHAVPLHLGRPVSDIVAELTAASGEYRQQTINGKLIVYPTSSGLEQVVRPPMEDWQQLPRFRAAQEYSKWLRRHVPGFENLATPIFIGNARGLARDEPVSLTPEATVLQHLIELLGTNPKRVFTIRPLPWGQPMLSFLIISWAAPLTAAPSLAMSGDAGERTASACASCVEYEENDPFVGSAGCPSHYSTTGWTPKNVTNPQM